MFHHKMKVLSRRVPAALIVAGMMTSGAAHADTVEEARSEVHVVSDAFYAALNEMLAGVPVSGRMAELWLDAEGVTALHPVGGRDTGLEALVGAFGGVASLASRGELTLEDQAIAIFGTTAVETGVETGRAVLADEEVTLDYRVTNVYVMTDEGWRMVHHHTDPSASLIDLLARLSN